MMRFLRFLGLLAGDAFRVLAVFVVLFLSPVIFPLVAVYRLISDSLRDTWELSQ